MPLLLADINRSIYGTCFKIGGSKPQLRHKQVGRIITPMILDVRRFKQKSQVIKFLNLMNMQIRTFDVERSKRRLTVVCETKWESVVCEMEICSLRNGNL